MTPKNREGLIELRCRIRNKHFDLFPPATQCAYLRNEAGALEDEEAAGLAVVPTACTAAQAVAMSDAAVQGGVNLPASAAATTFAYAAAVAASPFTKREG